MLLSMTGFGRATAETQNKKIIVEIKSLNSKQLDLSVRMPQSFRLHELELRNMVAHKAERGKIDIIVTVESTDSVATTHLNINALANYRQQIIEASERLGIDAPADWYGILLRLPDTLTTDTDAVSSDDETAALKKAVDEAVDGLMRHRRAEGEKLESFFALRIDRISELLKQVEPFEHERIAKIRQRLEENLAKLTLPEYDKGRLEQEMIFYIEKLDVNEEKQRLAQHLAYFIETMEQPTPGQGKKLGFIAQEMGREINTLGSKSNHAGMQKIVVRMKDELEQIKEQVLNVM